MCTTVLAATILETIQDKVANGEVFTAFDITLAVRKDEAGKVPHHDIRRILNNEFDTGQLGGYDRELCVLNAANKPQALVYFPIGQVASDHPLVDSSSSPTPVSSTDSTDSTDDLDVITMTAEGRINIPKNVLEQVTPTGSSYDFSVNGSIKCRSLTREGRIRFSMNELGLNGSKCRVTVDKTNDTIVLESV